MMGVHYFQVLPFKHNRVNKVFLFSANPKKPIDKTIRFDLDAAVVEGGIEIFASGWSRQRKFKAMRTGNTINITEGEGDSADQGLLFTATL